MSAIVWDSRCTTCTWARIVSQAMLGAVLLRNIGILTDALSKSQDKFVHATFATCSSIVFEDGWHELEKL